MATLGQQIRAARLKKKLTQAALAGELRVDRGTVIKWEKGRQRPGEENRSAIRSALDLEILAEPDDQIVELNGLELVARLDRIEATLAWLAAFVGEVANSSLPARTTEGELIQDPPDEAARHLREEIRRFSRRIEKELSDAADARDRLRAIEQRVSAHQRGPAQG